MSMAFSSTIRLAVIRGGNGVYRDGYDASLRTGKYILEHMPASYEGIDVLVDTQGVWHKGGMQQLPADILSQVDMIWDTTHMYKDMTVYGLPCIAPAKLYTPDMFTREGIRMPEQQSVRVDDMTDVRIRGIFTKFPQPSQVNGIVVHTLAELVEAVDDIRNEGRTEQVHIQEYIPGRRVVTGVIRGYRGEKSYVLPTVFPEKEKQEIVESVTKVHHILGFPAYIQVECVVHPKRGVYVVTVDTNPMLGGDTVFMQALATVGGTPEEMIGDVLTYIQ
jgi:hypothetical protein